MRIQHNIMAMNAYRNYNTNTSALSKNLEKLSSGYKINRAGDDAAGLAISEKMRAQITGLNAAQKNVKDGISLVKTAEGAMQEIQDMLNRMDYLATQSANGTYDNEVDRANLQKEVDALRTEIDRIADSANFNGIKLMNGDQKVQGADTAAVAVNVSSVTSNTGISQAGGTFAGTSTKLAGNFTPSGPNHTGLHPGSAYVAPTDPTFTVDISGVTITGVTSDTNSAVLVTINVAGQDIGVSVNHASATVMSGTVLAAEFDDVTVNIGGVEFTINAGTDGKLVFNLTTQNAGAADNVATTVNNLIKGQEVTVSVSGGDGGAGKLLGDWVHGVQDITNAVPTGASSLGGVSFKLNGDIVGDNYKLSIGDQTFVFKVNAATTVTTATGETLIDVSNVTGDIYKAAAEKIALSTTTIDSNDGATGGNTTFKISAVDGDTIHLDQVAVTDKVYTADKLKELFTLEQPETTAVKASITLSAGLDAGVKDGDVVAYNSKTYTIGTAPADAKNPDSYMSAASFNALLSESALNSLKKAAEEVVSAGTYNGNYTVTVANGNVKIEATTGNGSDTSAVLTKIQELVDAKVADISMSKIAKDDIGKGGLTLQIGDTSEGFNKMSVIIGDMHTAAMGTMEELAGGEKVATAGNSIADIDISNPEGASKAIDVIKNAINYVSSVRGDLGAIQNRLEHTANNLSVMAENIQDAESTIRDTDVAEEMMAYTKNNILIQSAQAMLAQANAVPQGVLQLLG